MANRDFDLVNRQLDDITTSYTSVGNALGRQGKIIANLDVKLKQEKNISLKNALHNLTGDVCVRR